MRILILDALILKLLKFLDLVKKYDCLRKVKNRVFCLCMIWKLCDSDLSVVKFTGNLWRHGPKPIQGIPWFIITRHQNSYCHWWHGVASF